MSQRRILVSAVVLLGCVGVAARGQPPDAVPAWIEEGRKSKLGVGVKSTKKGAVVQFVVEGSPAWRAGLESGDVILSVDWFTVGMIDGVEYPLRSEVRRVRGVGAFKVWNPRTQRVKTKRIDLGRDREDDGDDEEGGDDGYRRKP